MHHRLQLAFPTAGFVDVDNDPPRAGTLVLKGQDSGGQIRRSVGRIDGQQDGGAPWEKRDDDAASFGLAALTGRARRLCAAVSTEKRHR